MADIAPEEFAKVADVSVAFSAANSTTSRSSVGADASTDSGFHETAHKERRGGVHRGSPFFAKVRNVAKLLNIDDDDLSTSSTRRCSS